MLQLRRLLGTHPRPPRRVRAKEKQPIASGDTSTSGKDDAETKENAES